MNLFFRLAVFVTFFFLTSSPSIGSENKQLLTEADSLYQSKKYTEAFQYYEQLFNENEGSPAMLARMAFIKEGLGDYTNALYFLNLYYNQTSDKKVLTKMRELADKYNLRGYEYSDGVFITGIIQKYQFELIALLFAISFILTFYIFRKKQKKEKPLTSAIFQMITLATIIVLINGLFINNYVIVTQGQTLLMSGPSAGAEPIEFLEKGHRIKLLETEEVWSKVIWNDREVFIRNSSLKKI